MLQSFAIIGLWGCVLANGTACGASATATTPSASAVTAATQNVDPKNLAVAKEIISSYDMNSMMQNVLAVMSKTLMPLIMRDNPRQSQQAQQVALDAVQKAFSRHMSEFENNKAIVYAQIYTYDELLQLKTFYKSPVGQKMLKTMPDMMEKTMVLDQKVILETMDEVKADIMESLRRNNLVVPKEMGL